MEYQFVFDIIKEECENQKKKWGLQRHHDTVWLTILSEEVGEAARAILENDKDQTTAELIQCAAVVVSWLMMETKEDNG